MGLFGKGFADKLGDLGTTLIGSQAAIDGDFASADNIWGMQQKRAQDLRKQAEGEQLKARLLAGLKGQGLSDDQAMLVLNNAGSIGDFRQKPAEQPAFVKNLEAWQQMDPQKRQEVAQMQSVLNPRFMTGADGLPYQQGPAQVPQPAPWQQNPDDWEMVPGPQQGGGAGNGAGGFPSNRIPSGSPLDPWPRR